MTHIVHRRTAVLRRTEPSVFEAITASLSPVGAISALLAVFSLVVGLALFVMTQAGGATPLQWFGSVLSSLSTAAVIGLPAALEVGFPGARRRNRWLWRGLVLLAVSQAALIGLSVFQDWMQAGTFLAMDQGSVAALAFNAGFLTLTLAVRLAGILGALLIGGGLAGAGARPPRVLIYVPAFLVAAAFLVLFGQYIGFVPTTLDWWLNVVTVVVLWLLPILVWVAVGLRLVAGLAMGLVPRSAWVVGAIAGVLLIAYWVLNAPTLELVQNQVLTLLVRIGGLLTWVLLNAALLLGLGRGTRGRRTRPRLVRLFVLDPTD